MFKLHPRVMEVATTTGAGTLTLANTVQTGFVRFSDIPGVADGDLVPYYAFDETASPVAWEEGFGTYNLTAKTLARTKVLSNNSGTTSAVNFAAAPKVILAQTTNMARNGPYQLRAGRYYTNPSALTEEAAGVKVLLSPFYVPNPIQLSTLSIRFGGTVNAGTLCLGVVSDNEGQPGSTLAQASQSVGSGNANSTVSLSVSTFLVPGLYWLASSLTATANATCFAREAAGGSAYGFSALHAASGNSSALDSISMRGTGYSSTDTPTTSLPSTYAGLAPNTSNSHPVVAAGF